MLFFITVASTYSSFCYFSVVPFLSSFVACCIVGGQEEVQMRGDSISSIDEVDHCEILMWSVTMVVIA